MRVFLTGGTGYLGSAIAAQLVGRGHAVSGLARFRPLGRRPGRGWRRPPSG
jgi:nucleoside-diphosphate-sugar epimerase